MNSAFLSIAAALAIGAALLLLLPLVRGRQQQKPATVTAVVTLCVLLGGGGALYAWLGNSQWREATPVTNTPVAMTAKLARRLARQPDDLQGWLLLGRSYMELEQFPLAARAFQRADGLAQNRNVEALMGLAEAIISQDPEELSGEAGRLFDRALELEPRNIKALFYGAYAALSRGEAATGRARFEGMLALDLPDQIRDIVQKQVEAIDAAGAAPVQVQAQAQGQAQGQGQAQEQGASADARVRVRVSVSPELRYQVTPQSALFVMARDPNQPGPPFAAKRLPLQFPVEVMLTGADAMMPQRRIASGQKLEIVARISLSGQPQSSSGDPFGQVGYHVGQDGQLQLVIDKLAP